MGNALVDGHLDGDMNEIMMLGTTSSVNQDRIICGLFEQIISNKRQITTGLFAIICGLFVGYLRLFADYLPDYLSDYLRLFVGLFVGLFEIICRIICRIICDYLSDYFLVICSLF